MAKLINGGYAAPTPFKTYDSFEEVAEAIAAWQVKGIDFNNPKHVAKYDHMQAEADRLYKGTISEMNKGVTDWGMLDHF